MLMTVVCFFFRDAEGFNQNARKTLFEDDKRVVKLTVYIGISFCYLLLFLD